MVSSVASCSLGFDEYAEGAGGHGLSSTGGSAGQGAAESGAAGAGIGGEASGGSGGAGHGGAGGANTGGAEGGGGGAPPTGCVWSAVYPGTSLNQITDVAVMDTGLYVVGLMGSTEEGSINLGGGELEGRQFLSRLGVSDGSHQWSRSFLGAGFYAPTTQLGEEPFPASLPRLSPVLDQNELAMSGHVRKADAAFEIQPETAVLSSNTTDIETALIARFTSNGTYVSHGATEGRRLALPDVASHSAAILGLGFVDNATTPDQTVPVLSEGAGPALTEAYSLDAAEAIPRQIHINENGELLFSSWYAGEIETGPTTYVAEGKLSSLILKVKSSDTVWATEFSPSTEEGKVRVHAMALGAEADEIRDVVALVEVVETSVSLVGACAALDAAGTDALFLVQLSGATGNCKVASKLGTLTGEFAGPGNLDRIRMASSASGEIAMTVRKTVTSSDMVLDFGCGPTTLGCGVVAKLNSNLTCAWHKAPENLCPHAVAISDDGNVAVGAQLLPAKSLDLGCGVLAHPGGGDSRVVLGVLDGP